MSSINLTLIKRSVRLPILGIEQWLLNWISSVFTFMQWPGVVGLMAIESACIPIPSEIIMPLSGWMLIRDSSLSPFYVFAAGAYGALGCLIGSIVTYWVGWMGGRPLLNKYGKYILITHHDLDTADRWFKKYGSQSAFISRLIPVVRTFISLPAGIAKTNFVKFCIYTFIGSYIWCTLLAYLGYLLGDNWEEIRTVTRPFDYLIIAVIVILIGYYIYRHVRHYREQSKNDSSH
jgi:membrane protein DedA with SNARE-associated domain